MVSRSVVVVAVARRAGRGRGVIGLRGGDNRMMSRRSLVAAGLVLAASFVVRDVAGQPRKPTITVYRDPT